MSVSNQLSVSERMDPCMVTSVCEYIAYLDKQTHTALYEKHHECHDQTLSELKQAVSAYARMRVYINSRKCTDLL